MSTSKTEYLMDIATNPNLRIHEKIEKIKGEDRKINSSAEANAILAIPASDVVITDNKNALCNAKMEAYSFLKEQKAKKKDSNTDLDALKILSQAYKNYKNIQKTINDIDKFIKKYRQFDYIF